MYRVIRIFLGFKYIAFVLMLCLLVFLLLRNTASKIVSPKDLSVFIQNGNLEDLEKYAERNDLSIDDKNSLLSIASIYGKNQMVEWLIGKGADINAIDDYGCTPLHDAVRAKKSDTVGILLKYGAEINARDNNGNTPLHTAMSRNANSTIVDVLLNRNADVNIANNIGQTPIFVAVSRGHIETVKILIEYGADVNVADAAGETPLTIAHHRQEEHLHEYMKKIYKDIEIILRCTTQKPI